MNRKVCSAKEFHMLKVDTPKQPSIYETVFLLSFFL